jgi:gluconate kinase
MSNVGGQRSPIYVLHGIAGIGKSTIAQTIAQRAAELGYLGASFFFSRNEEHRKSGKLFFSTIALQLSQHDPAFASHIGAALERVPDAATRRIPDQLKELIINPLHEHCRSNSRLVLIVIDALDECDVQDGKEILNLLRQAMPQLAYFKVFITTRPEQHIRHLLDGRSHDQFFLHEIEDSIVQADIRLYLQHQLSQEMVQNELPELELPTWEPSFKDLEALIQAAGKLFIIASTSVRFILDTTAINPCSQMAILLSSSEQETATKGPQRELDVIYLQILRSAVPEDSGNHIVERFQKVVGTIILLQNPLPTRALANLLAMDINDINRALSHLHSIIAPSSLDGSPQIYHKSFPDFITNVERCTMDKRFLITPKMHHSHIAIQCFQIMDHQLHANICNLGFPECYLDNSKVRHLTDGRVLPELTYACSYYATHLSQADTKHKELAELVENFVLKHLLNWLEVLSIIGRLDAAYPALENIKRFISAVSDNLI